jgi:hypothetical protein
MHSMQVFNHVDIPDGLSFMTVLSGDIEGLDEALAGDAAYEASVSMLLISSRDSGSFVQCQLSFRLIHSASSA